jgi:hypothetical protein
MDEKLVDGRIPAFTECPFRKECSLATHNVCKHKGVLHEVPFSCAVARGFEMLKELDNRMLGG